MPNNIYHKRNANPGVVPTAAQLTAGEIALNTADGKAYTRTTAGTVVELTEASVADGGEQFTPLNISNLALWLDASDANSLYTTDAGPVTAVSSPLDIAGCIGWWDASDASSITQSGGLVSQWNDKSGNGRHATQATGSKRPIYTNTWNQKGVVTFQGTDDTMEVAADAAFTASSQTLFIACRQPVAAFGSVFVRSAGSSGNGVLVRYRTNAIWLYQRNTNEDATLSAPHITSPTILSVVLQPASQGGFRNGVSVATAALATTYDSSEKIWLGSLRDESDYFVGDIAEAILYPSALSITDRARVEAYLAAKWGISGVHAPATATNDPVGAWLDKSGNGRRFSQAGSASRPTVSAIGSRAALAFDGTNDWLSAVTPLPTAMPLSMFIVQRIVAGTSFGMTYTADVTGFNVRQTGNIVGALSIVPGNFDLSVLTRVGVNDVISLVYPTSGNNGLFLNGAPLPLNDATTRPTLAGTHAIGVRVNADGSTSFPANVRVAEIIAYNAALTATQRQRVERYLADKWGITAAPQVSNLDAQDWINRVYQNNGTVSQSTAAAVNTFCNAINAAGIRDRFYRLNLFCGNNLAACLVPLYRGQSLGGTQFGNTTDTNVNFAASDYNERGANGGLVGNGSNKYLNTGVITDLFASATDGHLSYYAPQWTPTTTANPGHAALGAQDSGGAAIIYGRGNSGSCGVGSAAHVGVIGITGGTLCGETGNDIGGGHTIVSRTGSAAFGAGLYRNGTLAVSGNPNTYTPSNLPAYVFAFSFWLSGAVSVGGWSPIRMRGYSFGLGMTNSQISALYNATQTFQTTLARNV